MRTTEENSKFISAKESERWRANMRREDAFTGYMEYCEQEAASLRVQCFIVRIALIASLMANVIMAMP